MKLTVVYITGRKDPRVDWAVEDLSRQIKRKDKIHLIIVDTFNRSPAALGIRSKRIEDVVVAPPKPNIWQGFHRVTSVDWWDAAIDRFKPRKSTEFTPDLKAIRKQLSRSGSFPIPDPQGDYRDWYDGTPIRSAVPPPPLPGVQRSLPPARGVDGVDQPSRVQRDLLQALRSAGMGRVEPAEEAVRKS